MDELLFLLCFLKKIFFEISLATEILREHSKEKLMVQTYNQKIELKSPLP
jgi:hypothetical protein